VKTHPYTPPKRGFKKIWTPPERGIKQGPLPGGARGVGYFLGTELSKSEGLRSRDFYFENIATYVLFYLKLLKD
jgi:hypothetical protein